MRWFFQKRVKMAIKHLAIWDRDNKSPEGSPVMHSGSAADTSLANGSIFVPTDMSATDNIEVKRGGTYSAIGFLGDLASTALGKGAALIGIHDVGGIITATTVEAALQENRTAIDALEVQTAAIGAEDTDGQLQIPINAGTAAAGTYTPGVGTGTGEEAVVRTAAAGADDYWIPVPIPARSAALKGIKPTGLLVNYEVDTAAPDDVRFELWKVTQGADGAARTLR